MAKDNYVFNRIEKKFILSKEKTKEFIDKITPFVVPDEYGEYTISNLYFDSDDYDIVRTSIEKPVYKEKLRLRAYGVPEQDDKVFLELKKKYDKTVFKRRITLKKCEADSFISGDGWNNDDEQIAKEIEYFILYHNCYPRVYLSYDRQAFSGKEDSELRITIDKNLTARDYDLDLSKGSYGDYHELVDERMIEIKVHGSYPFWLLAILEEMGMSTTSYSKYGTIYKKYLIDKWRKNYA